MKCKVKKTFEGDLGNGPQTVHEGLELELEPVGEVTYWLAMGWVEPVKEKAESAAKEAPEKAVKPAARKRTTTTKRSTK